MTDDEPHDENVQKQNGKPSSDRNENGQGHTDQKAAEWTDGDNVPFFRPAPVNPDEKAKNDCFFDSCVTKTCWHCYLIKHFKEKHCLIRSDQRPGLGTQRSPKYLTVCPTDWPFNHNSRTSCRFCDNIIGLTTVLGQREHESPAICSLCWAYLPTRRDPATHITQKTCKKNGTFPRKLALIWRMYADTLRIPGADKISRFVLVGQTAYAENERVARLMKQEPHKREQAQIEPRKLRPLAPKPQPLPLPQAYPFPHPATSHSIARPCRQYAPLTPSPDIATLPLHSPAAPAQLPTPEATPEATPPPVDYVTPSSSAVAAESMARSIDRLAGAVSDLTEANKRLLREVRMRDEHIRDLRAERRRSLSPCLGSRSASCLRSRSTRLRLTRSLSPCSGREGA
ncbi:hypothetical protein B0I37DRAFT_368137 [Chaetomium sp. MPI-CAGE-AT-0009]|nr:hypothetical protein B0I37DRAFT_368137 [Chaetomium sp. MPI-CAGE-AT-0009]